MSHKDEPLPKPATPPDSMGRRTLIMAGSLSAAGILSAAAFHQLAAARLGTARVFVARNQSYTGDLRRTIRDGLIASGLQPEGLRDKRVMLKPNMVEPSRAARHMTTHPAVLLATAEVFRGWGATVLVGEGPGHVRDTEMALEESGMREALDDGRLTFADLNYEETAFQKNLGRSSTLPGFHFPTSVLGVDLIVSLPKMKTHHWQGVTASLKNMYGVIPGIRYGWPKNVLHFNGIPNTVFDINASLPKTIAVVDAIDCMEGDGPIMGTRKHMGLLVIGVIPTAVDATVCRLMQVRPEKIPYLALAAGRLGPLEDASIEQVGERWQPLASPFEILDVEHLRGMRAGEKVS